MKQPGGNDADAARHPYGPRPLGALVAAVTRPAFKKRAPAAAQVLSDWDEIVGPDLAASTAPRRLTGGSLTLSCSGPTALELQHLSDQLIARINGHLGREVVVRLRFVQDASPVPTRPPSPKRRSKPVQVHGLPPGPLHDALVALGRAVREGDGA